MLDNTLNRDIVKAKLALLKYLKDNKLDPEKDWTKDPIHGEKVTHLLIKLNKRRDKLAAIYPINNLPTEIKLIKMAKEKKAKKHAAKIAEAPVENKKAAKKVAGKEEKVAKAPKASKYDYPLVDGKEMTPEQKKKYRAEQRRLAKGDAPKPAKKKDKKKKVVKEEEATPAKKKDKKKKKKQHKEED